VSPHRTRALLEIWLDDLGWTWSSYISLWIDETVIRQEARGL